MTTIIAAVATCFAVFGDCGYTPATPTGWVYKWKFSGKTTYGVKTAKVKTASQNLCGYVPTESDCNTCAVRVPASLKIEGYTWACAPGCGSDAFE